MIREINSSHIPIVGDDTIGLEDRCHGTSHRDRGDAVTMNCGQYKDIPLVLISDQQQVFTGKGTGLTPGDRYLKGVGREAVSIFPHGPTSGRGSGGEGLEQGDTSIKVIHVQVVTLI